MPFSVSERGTIQHGFVIDDVRKPHDQQLFVCERGSGFGVRRGLNEYGRFNKAIWCAESGVPFIWLVVVGSCLPGRLFGLFEHPNGWGALVGAGPLVVAAFRSSWGWLLGSLVASWSLGRIRG